MLLPLTPPRRHLLLSSKQRLVAQLLLQGVGSGGDGCGRGLCGGIVAGVRQLLERALATRGCRKDERRRLCRLGSGPLGRPGG